MCGRASWVQGEDCILHQCVVQLATCGFFFSSRRRHTRSLCDWSSDVCSSDLGEWCNGSTAASGAACLGSNPSSPAFRSTNLDNATKQITKHFRRNAERAPVAARCELGAFWGHYCRRFGATSLDGECRILAEGIPRAWLEQRSGLYRVAFRHGGRKLHYSVGSDNQKEAQACLSRLEENLRLVERGRLEVPPGADLAVFLVTDGKLNAKPVIDQALTLAEVFEQYDVQLPQGAKEANTRYTERIHLEHLKRLIGARIPFKGLTTDALQRYVDDRSKETGRKGKPLNHTTIQKE